MSHLSLEEARRLPGWCARCDEPHGRGGCSRWSRQRVPTATPTSSVASRALDPHAELARQLEEHPAVPPFVAELEVLGPEEWHAACGGTGRAQRAGREVKCGPCGGTGTRRAAWRADLAWKKERLVVEVDGGVHALRRQHEADVRKRRWLAITGWTVLPVLNHEVRDGSAVEWIARWFRERDQNEELSDD